MKTQTRANILKLIEKKGQIRPHSLRTLLHISAQALHRHLRSLVEQGMLEVRGVPPFTEYAIAGSPDFSKAAAWLNARQGSSGPAEFICETREIFSARLPHLKTLIRSGLPEQLLPVVIATAGEIGSNSFDHNLGQWRDVPGCWFETQVTGKY